jgi:hypothetical protein
MTIRRPTRALKGVSENDPKRGRFIRPLPEPNTSKSRVFNPNGQTAAKQMRRIHEFPFEFDLCLRSLPALKTKVSD